MATISGGSVPQPAAPHQEEQGREAYEPQGLAAKGPRILFLFGRQRSGGRFAAPARSAAIAASKSSA